MEEELPPGTPRHPREKPRVRRAPPPVTVNYRVAFVGTVAFADADRDMLKTFKYGATAADSPGAILHAMMQDVHRALRQDGSLRIVVVQDAAKEMWTRVMAALEAEPSVFHWNAAKTMARWKARADVSAPVSGGKIAASRRPSPAEPRPSTGGSSGTGTPR